MASNFKTLRASVLAVPNWCSVGEQKYNCSVEDIFKFCSSEHRELALIMFAGTVVITTSLLLFITGGVVHALATCTNRTGILINGIIGGTQLFDPYCTDNHTIGNMQLGLQTGYNAHGGAAVISGHLAYFGGTGVQNV